MKTESHRIVRIDALACAKTCSLIAAGVAVILTVLAWAFSPFWMGGYGMTTTMMGGMMTMMGANAFGLGLGVLGAGAAVLWVYALVWGFVVAWVFAGLYNLAAGVTGGWRSDVEHGANAARGKGGKR